MCGCVGFFHLDKRPVDRSALLRASDALKHRGPNDAGIWFSSDRAVGLAHRRLSILDISPTGHQPMKSKNGRFIITYNGEVYNFIEIRRELIDLGYTFSSESDTEVVLNAYDRWGEKCVERFIGMFAFGIWDEATKGLFLARDRMGIKPLYYYFDDNTFLFASRLGGLLAHPCCPRDIDPEALGFYLDIGFVPAPWSILNGVKKLRPGYSLWIDGNGVKERCYWSINTIPINISLGKESENDLTERLDLLLRESVRLRLISDVPVGAFLSGGVDSSLIVALMCQVTNTPPETFTIGFKEKQYDESNYARDIANHLGTKHHDLVMQSNDLLSVIDDNTDHYDEPFADWSSLPMMLISKFAKEQVTVCLSGDGGDELFAGYHYYSLLSQLRPLYCLPRFLRTSVASGLVRTGHHRLALLGHALSKNNLVDSFSFMRSMIKDYGRSSLLKKNTKSIGDLFQERCLYFPHLDDISKCCRLDAAYYLSDDILQKVDVASMSVGLEARVPLLDHRVVEFAQSLPIGFKQRHGQGKWILKKVLSRYIPLKLFDRPKSGFCVPIREWFRGELKEVLQDELSTSRIKQLGFLEPAGVQRLINLHLSGKRDTHPMLWALISLIRWNTRIREFPHE